MILLRSLVFNLFFVGVQAFLVLLMVLLLPFPRGAMQGAVRLWTRLLRAVMRGLLGIRFEVRGRENLPAGPCLIAAKHQSAWDTFAFYLLVDDPLYVMKIELLRLPVWGTLARKAGMVAVDRAAGASALKRMVADVKERLSWGSQVIIFPEGTRTAPGTKRPYHPGIAALYAAVEVPVIPVAINSGLLWGRQAFRKYPGTIVMDILPAIPAGLSRKAFMIRLESDIEAATGRLCGDSGEPDAVDKPVDS